MAAGAPAAGRAVRICAVTHGESLTWIRGSGRFACATGSASARRCISRIALAKPAVHNATSNRRRTTMSRQRSGKTAGQRRSRRNFLGVTAGAGLGLLIVPRHVLGGAGFVPPSERVNLAGIGAGGMGGGDIATHAKNGANIVALCDVDEQRAAGSFHTFPPGPALQRLPRHARQGGQSTSTRSASARPTTSMPWPPWPPSAPASTSIARSRSRTRSTNAAS